jgi:hypothetical protein
MCRPGVQDTRTSCDKKNLMAKGKWGLLNLFGLEVQPETSLCEHGKEPYGSTQGMKYLYQLSSH